MVIPLLDKTCNSSPTGINLKPTTIGGHCNTLCTRERCSSVVKHLYGAQSVQDQDLSTDPLELVFNNYLKKDRYMIYDN